MRDNTLKHLLLLAASLTLLTSIAAHAAGLGRLTVFSTLGQPLNAEVEILSPQKGETITGRLSTPETYQQAGSQFNNALVGTRVTLEKRPNGQLYLKLTTPRPIHEPFIELLVEINSEHGRVMRQYTALLDPPGYGSAAGELPPPLVASAPATRAPASAAPGPATPAPSAVPVPPRRTAAPAKPAPSTEGARQYGPIKPGETLGGIARTVKPAGVSLEQALVGLYRENPDAFIKKNMNLVRSGRILRVPEESRMSAVPQREAVQEVRMQVADFNTYRGRIADRATAASETGSVTSGRIGTQVADGAGPEPRDTVRLSRGESSKGQGKGASTTDRLRELEEEAIAREKSLAEANARIAQLEQIIKDSQRAVELKGSGAAPAQKGAEQASAPVAPGVSADKAPPPDAGKGVEPPLVADAPKGPETATSPDAAPQPEPAVQAKAPPPPAAPEPEPELDLISTIMEEPLYLAAGGVILLGGLGLVMARRRRNAALRGGDDLVKISPSLGGSGGGGSGASAPAPWPAAPATPAAPARTADTSPAAAPPRTADIAPAAPTRPAGSGKGDDNDLDFNVGMRRGPAAAAAAAPPPPVITPAPQRELTTRAPDSELTRRPEPSRTPELPRAPEPPPAPPVQVEPPPPAQSPLSRATEALRAAQGRAQPPQSAPLEPLMPDFALDTPSSAPNAPQAPATPARDSNLLEFDLDPLPPVGSAPLGIEKVSSEPPASVDFKLDLNDLDINAPASAGGSPARDDHWYDVQQKFDLAKAYEEMGDKNGARDILQEVLREGDTEQQSQAKKLLGALG